MLICKNCPKNNQRFSVDGTVWRAESIKYSARFEIAPDGDIIDVEEFDSIDYGDSEETDRNYNTQEIMCDNCNEKVQHVTSAQYYQWWNGGKPQQTIQELQNQLLKGVKK